MNRTGITVDSVLRDIENIPELEWQWMHEFCDGDPPPCWAVKGEVSAEAMISLPEVLALVRCWLDKGRHDAIRDLTELRLWT